MSDDFETKPERPGADAELGAAERVRREQTNRYVWGEELARGGMGVVQSVMDRPLHRQLARKLLRDELAHDENLAWMLVREARVTAQLAHPHVVPVHEIGVDTADRIYFTMKHVEGVTLRERVRERDQDAPVDWTELLDQIEVVIKVCDALAFAHSNGVIHCDIKPANIMIGEFGEVYLMDWGVARRLEDEERRSEADPDELAGTPQFMSPEQARAEPLDARADVFAVGALLYFVVSGRSPYRGRGLAVLVNAGLGERKPVTDSAPWAPPALVRLIDKAMAMERDERYDSIAQLRADLVRFVRGGDSFRVQTFETNEAIVRQGDEGDEAYIIERGRCVVTIDGAVIREMGPGDVFGEMGILSPGPRTATVTTLEPTTVRALSGELVREELDGMKPWMASLIRTIAARLRERG